MQSNITVEAFNSINHDLRELSKIKPTCSIYRVHKHLRDFNNDAYEPEIIAIGPYHRGKYNLKMMEEHKLHYLQLLLECQKHNVERYTSAIGELEQRARDCYVELISLNGAEFVKMLVLDGCFIIELVRKYNSADSATWEDDPIFQMEWIQRSLQRDLILFENQIPFFVLCELFDLIEGPNKHHTLIDYLIKFFPKFYPPRSNKIPHRRSSQDIKHLLDLVYSSWISSATHQSNINIIEKPYLFTVGRRFSFIHTATELKDANVGFHRMEGSQNTLSKVEFKNGIMHMPPLFIEHRTECFLRNLIAYEQYYQKYNRDNLITNYVILLDFLINTSSDVEVLCKSEIIINLLGDNEVVAKLVNRLGLSVIGREKRFAYAIMFWDVNVHYKRRCNRWVAMLKRHILNSPWAYISFFAALAILLLTVVQAVCSILQVV